MATRTVNNCPFTILGYPTIVLRTEWREGFFNLHLLELSVTQRRLPFAGTGGNEHNLLAFSFHRNLLNLKYELKYINFLLLKKQENKLLERHY